MSNFKILIIPSWYATKEKPNVGSFFREQSQLMCSKYDVSILFLEKNWISWRRYYFERYFKSTVNKLFPLQITPPSGNILRYNFIKLFSKSKNHKILLKEIEIGFQQYIAKNGNPDIIHAHCSFMGGIVAAHLSKVFKIPYIISEHYNPFILNEFDAFFISAIINALENANKVLAVSHHQRQNILMNRINCNPIVVGNLVDDDRFIIADKKESTSVVQLLIVTFYPNFIKDMDTFFNALELLVSRNIKFNATIIGGKSGGELNENYYTEEVEKRGLKKYCTIIPEADRDEMVYFMQQTDIFISTSIAESFGVAICEAMLCGKPVISTKNGGVNDFITEYNGKLVDIKDPIQLAEAIVELSSNLEKYPPEKIRNSIVEKFGKKAFFERIDKIYQSVIND